MIDRSIDHSIESPIARSFVRSFKPVVVMVSQIYPAIAVDDDDQLLRKEHTFTTIEIRCIFYRRNHSSYVQ
jgi:hypothetical protein